MLKWKRYRNYSCHISKFGLYEIIIDFCVVGYSPPCYGVSVVNESGREIFDAQIKAKTLLGAKREVAKIHMKEFFPLEYEILNLNQ